MTIPKEKIDKFSESLKANENLLLNDIKTCINFWRENKSLKRSIFPYFMTPRFIKDLHQFSDYYNGKPDTEVLDSDAIAVLEIIISRRIKRDSDSTRNAQSNTSIVMRHLSSAIDRAKESLLNRTQVLDDNTTTKPNSGCFPSFKTLSKCIPLRFQLFGSQSDMQTVSVRSTIQAIIRNFDNYVPELSNEEWRGFVLQITYTILYIHENLDEVSGYYGNYYDGAKNYNRMTFLSSNLCKFEPLHIHLERHTSRNEAKIYLQTIVDQFINSFKKAEETNQLDVFYNHLYGGLCIEARTRSLFNWAISLEQCKPKTIHELFEKVVKQKEIYFRYMKINGDSEDKFFYTDQLVGECCEEDQVYAPEGVITKESLCKYLCDILDYDRKNDKGFCRMIFL